MIPLTHLHATLAPHHPWRPKADPYPLPVILRSALGAAFFRELCVQVTPDCGPCPHASHCLIPNWWHPSRESGADLRPFVPRLRGGDGDGITSRQHPLQAELLLLGPIPAPGILRTALHQAAEDGLGAERVPHEVVELGMEAGLQPWPRGELVGEAGVRVRLHTPWQEKSQARGRTDPTRPPEPSALIWACLDRLRAVERQLGLERWGAWPDPPDGIGRWIEARHVARSVYSMRRGAALSLSGWMGSLSFGPEVEPFLDLLRIGQQLHVGRKTSYGLGLFEIEPA